MRKRADVRSSIALWAIYLYDDHAIVIATTRGGKSEITVEDTENSVLGTKRNKSEQRCSDLYIDGEVNDNYPNTAIPIKRGLRLFSGCNGRNIYTVKKGMNGTDESQGFSFT